MKEFHPRSGRYLVELGLTGEGRRGLQPALLACSQLTSTLLGGTGRVTRVRSQPGPAPAELCVHQAARGVKGSAYRGGSLGPLGSDHGLQAAATGLVLPPTGVFELAGSIKLPPNLDALLGATWEERLAGPCSVEAGGSAACTPCSPTQLGDQGPAHRGSSAGTGLGEACPPNSHPPGISVQTSLEVGSL